VSIEDVTNDAHLLPDDQSHCEVVSHVVYVNGVLPDDIPDAKGKKKETMRQELFRQSTQLPGKHKSKRQTDEIPQPPPPTRFVKPKRLDRELSSGTSAIDLNHDPL
jgi:hypothetical protein